MNGRDRDQLTVAPDGRPEADQPRWRQDFPIDWPQDEYIARRDFTKFMVLTSFAFAVGQLWILAQDYLRRSRRALPAREIAAVNDIPVGSSRIFNYPGAHEPALLVRLDESRFVAYDQRCTHLVCPVIPQIEAGRYYCPFHEGSFDLASGRPLAGPPRRPLTQIRLEIRGGRVFAVGIQERTA